MNTHVQQQDTQSDKTKLGKIDSHDLDSAISQQEHDSKSKQRSNSRNHEETEKIIDHSQQQSNGHGQQNPEEVEIITIEVCEKCKEHAWCTQHDEAKYNRLFEQVKAQLESHPELHLKVFRNVNHTNTNVAIKPKIGAFEIAHKGVIIYSKCKSSLFPNVSVINQRISKFFADKKSGSDLSKYATSTEKKMQNPQKGIDKAAIYGTYYVAIQKEQERQARLREEKEAQLFQEEEVQVEEDVQNMRISQEQADHTQPQEQNNENEDYNENNSNQQYDQHDQINSQFNHERNSQEHQQHVDDSNLQDHDQQLHH